MGRYLYVLLLHEQFVAHSHAHVCAAGRPGRGRAVQEATPAVAGLAVGARGLADAACQVGRCSHPGHYAPACPGKPGCHHAWSGSAGRAGVPGL